MQIAKRNIVAIGLFKSVGLSAGALCCICRLANRPGRQRCWSSHAWLVSRENLAAIGMR
jgi:hypothetical protein